MTLTSADMASSGSGRSERRRFTNEYKLRIVSEYDAATEHGQRGALLRREGLYDSHIGPPVTPPATGTACGGAGVLLNPLQGLVHDLGDLVGGSCRSEIICKSPEAFPMMSNTALVESSSVLSASTCARSRSFSRAVAVNALSGGVVPDGASRPASRARCHLPIHK